MKRNLPRLLDRFDISYFKEETCVEYFIADKSTAAQISYVIVLSLDTTSREIHVSKFYPELRKEGNARYLSAACFYLVVHHFAHVYHLDENYNISLDTLPATFERFFSRLKDFDFHVEGIKLCKTAELLSKFLPVDLNTSVIRKKIIENQDVPFHVW
ncbi:MAG: hypothetical protein JRF69_00750 [Deltaproteobacteria bacterium]|nr:hypothetical protein [Deltaproteobacteria bacterium]